MVSQKDIDSFLSEKVIAVAGVSRNKNKFGNQIYKQLKLKGFRVYAVNPFITQIEDIQCYPSINALPEKPGGVVVAVNKKNTLDVSVETFESGITKIWIQNGAESEEALQYCITQNMTLIYNQCILLFAQPDGFHKIHRWINGVFGKLPV